MDKSLATASYMPSANDVSMSGKQNINVNNQNGGTVNFNIKWGDGDSHNTAEQMVVVQSFSTEYYQLLVTEYKDVFRANTVLIRADEALLPDNVPAEIYKKCSSLDSDGKAFLTKIPAIVCLKNKQNPSADSLENLMIYCYVNDITKIIS